MMSTTKKHQENSLGSNRILAGTSIEGDLLSDGDVRIDGKVKGNIKVAGKLVIGEQGVIEGEADCKNASIAGRVEGTLKVAQMLSIVQTGKLNGQVLTEKLSVEPGAELNGSISMNTVIRKMAKEEEANSKTA